MHSLHLATQSDSIMSGQYLAHCVALWATIVLVFDLFGIEGSPSQILYSTSAALMGLGNALALVQHSDLLSNEALPRQTNRSLGSQSQRTAPNADAVDLPLLLS